MSKRKYKAAQIIEAIHEAGGVVAAAARMLGCDRPTSYRYAREYRTGQEAWDEPTEVNLDAAAATLIDYVQGVHKVDVNGETLEGPLDAKTRLDALKFYLRTKGRLRGYGDRMTVEFDPSDLSDEELEAIASGK